MILTGLAGTNALILQAGKAGQNVNRGNNALAVKLAGEDYLTLGNVAGKVGNGVGLVVLGHGENGYHSDRAFLAYAASCALIHRCKVGVEVAGIAAASGNFLLRSRNLTQSLCIVGNVRKDYKNVHILFKRQILSGGKRHARRCDTLNCRVVSEVCEKNGSVNSACAAELLYEVFRLLEGDADSGKNNGEV